MDSRLLPPHGNLRIGAVVLLLAATIAGGGTQEAGTPDEKLLRDAGIATDGAGLLKYFQARTLSDGDRARLAGLVADLGHASFPIREKSSAALIAAGEGALPLLKKALASDDAEVVQRAKNCIRRIEHAPPAMLTSAAARLLTLRRPDSAVDTLITYLPHADWEASGEDLLQALAVIGVRERGGKKEPLPPILAASRDKDPLRRLAAAYVLGRAGPDARTPLAKLTLDPDAAVRFHAGAGLLRCGDASGIPTLIGLLEKAPLPLAWRAEGLLNQLAANKAPLVKGDLSDAAVRRQWQAGYEQWWKENRGKVDLAQVQFDNPFQGLTLVCEIDGTGQFPGRVTAFTRNGAKAWAVEGFDSPTDVQGLTNGNLLVAEHWAKRVTERNRQGQIIQEWKFQDKPVTCRRLANGNTLVATYTEIAEISRAGVHVLSYKHQGDMIYCACVLANEHIQFITSQGRVTELDRQGKRVGTFIPAEFASGAIMWASVEPQRGGRYLIAFSGSNKVIETDDVGKIHWSCNVQSPCSAGKLPNGNILVASCDGRFAVEFDRDGKEVWKVATKGRPFWARRY